MDFIAKFHGSPPPSQDQAILFNDCDTNLPTSDNPSLLNVSPTQPWINASFVAPNVVRIGVDQNGLNAGAFTGSVGVTIPADETCEVGRVYSIPVNLTVQKGKVKFQ